MLFYLKKDSEIRITDFLLIPVPHPHTSPNLSLSRRGEASPSHSPLGEGETTNLA
ncbi:MAG: hypothetical protein LBQ59_05640 [Candidatus Peribacteria bacterium]|jgi:hypothetical protein|nr:hypothetical protein [Candidatus Peribacteria bacterium]